jgi:mannitol/fructose-specific phosphotransferase system IIA component (Ntr-type)
VKLSKYLKSDFLEPNLTATEKDPVLEQLVRLALPCIRQECPAEEETVLAALRDRETITSTGIGNGVAIPHAKIPGLKKTALVLARSIAGVNFEALDDAPVYLFFMVIAPPEAISEYLKLLAAISSFVKNQANRDALLNASTKSDMLAAIKAGEAV